MATGVSAHTADESIQPLMRMVNRIHVMEEARHIGFARAELTRSLAAMSRAEPAMQRPWPRGGGPGGCGCLP